MKIWTTREFADIFFPGSKFTLEIRLPKGMEKAFLQGAVPGDMAVIDLPEEYIEFLAAAKTRGIPGPFILISPEPTIIDQQLKRYNAMILDILKIELSEIREVVNFIAGNARECAVRTGLGGEEAAGAQFETIEKEKPVQERDPARIREVLEYIFRAGIPVIISAQITEEGTSVTARGLCYIEAWGSRGIILCRFSPPALSTASGKKARVKLVLSHRDENYETALAVLKAVPDKILVALPESLFIEKRGHMRIEPSKKNPVLLHILRVNKPTIVCRVADISIDGLCFEAGAELAVGGIYVFTIVLPGKAGIVQGYGKVIYKKPSAETTMSRYGVQLNVYHGEQQPIAQYMMNREKEIAALLKKQVL